MKNECKIVQDLLINYSDDVLNDESKILVEEHLKTCKECEQKLEIIKKESNDDKEQYIINYIKKLKRKIIVKSICIAIGLIFAVIIGTFLREIIIINKCLYNNEKLLEEDNVYVENISTLSDGMVGIFKNYYKDGKRKLVVSTYSDSGEQIITTQYDDANSNRRISIDEDRKTYEEMDVNINENNMKHLIFIDKNLHSFSNLIRMAVEYEIKVEYEQERYSSQKNKYYVLKNLNDDECVRENWYSADTGLLTKEISRYTITEYFPLTNIIKEVINREDIKRYSYSIGTVKDSDVMPGNLDEYIEPVVVKTLSPSGFAGSSLFKVELYSNGDLVLIEEVGDGRILNKGIISYNILDIKKESGGGIVAIGNDVNTQYGSYPWIKLVNE